MLAYIQLGDNMDVKEALCRIGDRIETDAYMYRIALDQGAIVEIEEPVDDGVIVVRIEKRDSTR